MFCREKITKLSACDLNALTNSKEFFSLKKNDTSATVGRIRGGLFDLSFDVWLKRFNSKGTLDFLVKKAFGSRAKRLWIINQRLFEAGLPVPEPIAFFEPSLKLRHSFFISTVIKNSHDLGSIYVRGQFNESAQFAKQLAKTLAGWHEAGAVHGDLKWSNILLQESDSSRKFFFVDLDQAKLYSRPKIKGMINDLVRFYRYGLELGAEEWVESKFFPAYMAELPDKLKAKIDLSCIKNKALNIWCKKGSKRIPLIDK